MVSSTGPLARVRGQRLEATNYAVSAEHLQEVWIAVRVNLQSVLEHVTLLDVIAGRLPALATYVTGESTLRALPG